MKQVEPFPVWPSGEGWTVAVLRSSPATVAKRWRISFSDGADGLGPFKLAAIEEPAVGQIWLFAHSNAPVRGTEVVVDASVSRDDALAALWRELKIDVRSLSWLTQHQIHPGRQALPVDARKQPAAGFEANDKTGAELRHLVAATQSLVDEAIHLLGVEEADNCPNCSAAECSCPSPSRVAVRSDLVRARAALNRASELTRR
jgi:hypothetical protein